MTDEVRVHDRYFSGLERNHDKELFDQIFCHAHRNTRPFYCSVSNSDVERKNSAMSGFCHCGARSLVLAILALMIFGIDSAAMTASDKEEYERRGLSQVEWEMVLDARMPVKKVDDLLKAGISITEYFRYPWLKYGISEEEWIRSRRAGLLESDIAAENRPRQQSSDGAVVISAFILPGLHQFKRDQHWKGAIMTGAATLSAISMAAISVAKKNFVPGPLIILVPAMLWSSLDIGFQIHAESNPDAARFSSAPGQQKDLRYSLFIRSR